MTGFNILEQGPLVLGASPTDFQRWMERAFSLRTSRHGHRLLCFSPTGYPYQILSHQQKSRHNFVSLSITGTSCALQCDHCRGRLLGAMIPAPTPKELLEACRQVAEAGGEGVLISGGADIAGHVPLARFIDTISAARHELGLRVVVHTGLVTRQTAEGLARAGVDAAMLDVIGSSSVSRSVYHLDDGPRLMRESLLYLQRAGVPVVPHVLVGLDYGRLNGELQALHIISETHPAAVVLIVLSPLRHTPMAHVNPPSPEDIARLMVIARLGLADVPLLLGCARPLGQHKVETDKFAVRAGVNGIAYVSQEGVDTAVAMGLVPEFFDVCCSLAYQLLD